MNKKGDDPQNTAYYVVIGIIIAVIIMFTFAKCALPFLKPKDVTLEKFNLLADKIEEISKASDEQTEAVLIHLETNEFILFFDQGINASLFFSSTRYDLKNNYPLSQENSVLVELLHEQDITSKYSPFFVFSKPESCQNHSCMVLCDKFDLFSPDDALGYFNKQFPDKSEFKDITYQDGSFMVVSCGHTKSLRTFPSITSFHQKPNSYDVNWKKGLEDTPDWIKKLSPMSLTKNFYFYGATLFYCSKGFSTKDYEEAKEGMNAIVHNAKIDACTGDNIKFVEYDDENKPQAVSQLKDHYVYVEPLGQKVFLCYQSPCTTFEDRIYTPWQKYLTQCLESNNCNSLFTAIDMYTDTSDLVFSTKDGKLSITHDTYVLPFDMKVKLLVKQVSGNTDPQSVDEVTLKKEELGVISTQKTVTLLTLQAGDSTYKLFDITSIKGDAAQNLEPSLIFKVDELGFETK